MFFDRWSNKVTLPLGTKWGNNIGGVAGCMNWTRPPRPPGDERPRTSFNRYGRGEHQFEQVLHGDNFNNEHISYRQPTHRPYYEKQQMYNRHQEVGSGGDYFNLDKDHWIYKDLNIKQTSRPNSVIGRKASLSNHDLSNADVLMARLTAMKKRNEEERLKREGERKAIVRRLGYDPKATGSQVIAKPKGYGIMGPPPQRKFTVPTPPASRGRTRPASSAGRTETYRYTEREVVIEDMDNSDAHSMVRNRTARPNSHHGSTYRPHTSKYSRPHTAYGLPREHQNQLSLTYNDEENFRPTPLALQSREFDSLSTRDPKDRLSSSRGPYNPYLSTLNNSDDGITIHVDCGKLVDDRKSKPRSVTVRLHGIPSADAKDVKVLTIPNTADSK